MLPSHRACRVALVLVLLQGAGLSRAQDGAARQGYLPPPSTSGLSGGPGRPPTFPVAAQPPDKDGKKEEKPKAAPPPAGGKQTGDGDQTNGYADTGGHWRGSSGRTPAGQSATAPARRQTKTPALPPGFPHRPQRR